jgi:hypothetical protein
MKKMTLIRIVLLTAALFMPIRAGLIYLGEAVAVDNCLDMGGSFNYGTMSCDFEMNHPYIPFKIRHPHLLQKSGIGFVSGMLLLAGSILLPRRNRKQNNEANRTSSVGPVA